MFRSLPALPRACLVASLLGALSIAGSGHAGPASQVSAGARPTHLDQPRQAARVDDLTVALNRLGGKAQFTMPASHDLDAIPADPRNRLTPAKVALGRFLFHDTALATAPKLPGTAGTYSCASCHRAARGFQAGLAQGIGEGGVGTRHRRVAPGADPAQVDVQPVRTPSAMNTAWQRVMLWNGQFGATGPNAGTEAAWTPGTPKASNLLGYQGVETQAIAGQGVHRLGPAPAAYRPWFDHVFADWPADRRHGAEAAGLAIAAYERTLMANRAPFQRWLRGDAGALDARQIRGGALFFGKARCVACHSGPALNSESFHALGMPDLVGLGVDTAVQAEHRGRGGFTGQADDQYKFKTPQLYNLADSPFFGHGGSMTDLRAVVAYFNAGVPENPEVPAAQLAPAFKPLGLSAAEIDDLTEFLKTGLRDPELTRYQPATLPSGQCAISDDAQVRQETGCPGK